jgi:lysophospholipase L1-like esterase
VAESIGQKLRRLESAARWNNPILNVALMSVPAWRPNTNFVAGQVVTNNSLNYICSSGGQSAASGGPTGTGPAAIIDAGVTWFFYGVTGNANSPTVPMVNVAASLPGGLSLTYPIPASAGVFYFSGGVPFLKNGFEYSFPCVTEPGNANASTTASNYALSVSFVTDAPKFAIAQVNNNTLPWRIIVDGQYISISGTVGSSGANPSYNIVDFTNAGGRKARKITIECTQAWQFAGVACGPTDKVWAPDSSDNIRAIVVGDSLVSGSAQGPFIGRLDWPSQIGKYLGWSDVWNSGSGGTGYINNAGTKDNFIQRVADVTGNAPDLVLIEGGTNDSGFSAANVQAAVLAYLQSIRSSLTTVPIIVLGLLSAGGPSAATISTENAVAAGVTQFADALTFFVPVATAANPWLTGTGTVSVPTGTGNCDNYTGPDATHPTQAGIDYFASRIANAVRNVIQQIP